MTKLPISVILTAVAIFACVTSVVHGLGSGATIAVDDQSETVCGIVAGKRTQHIVCYDKNGNKNTLEPTVSFSSIAAGQNFLCGIRSGGSSLFCWNTIGNRKFVPKRIYYNESVPIENLSVGDKQVCATVIGTGVVSCWRGDNFTRPPPSLNKEGFASVSSGFGFTCGILIGSKLVRCWGNKTIAGRIQTAFGNMTMSSLVSGVSHVCGMNSTGNFVCKGSNEFQQLNIPSSSTMEYSGLALGANNTCAIRQLNGSVVCLGGDTDTDTDTESYRNSTEGFCFDSIVAGPKLTCGLTATNFSIKCWGFDRRNLSDSSSASSFLDFLPGPFISNGPCSGSRNICSRCLNPIPTPPSPPASPPSSKLTNGLLAFAIIGSLGTFSGICSIIYWLWTSVFSGKKKVHNSVQPKITRDGGGSKGGSGSSNLTAPSRSLKPKRRSSKLLSIRRQRSGTSMKHPDIAAEFTLAELAAATDNFSSANKIGAGSFGIVYTGKLPDGSLVAIKRGETRIKKNKLQEKEIAFDSELAFLSRVHHKHLVRLVGFCEEDEERLLVYEYMKNGALYDHLHSKNNLTQTDSMINSWKTRIKIALDASRGIEYLHNYAVPPIIHRDIKSSNILLSDDWTARVSDFGLSLMYPEKNHEYKDVKAAGTFGYIDPEYYGLNVLTTKSDVYGFGVVLLELLTGRRAIFKDCEEGFGGNPVSIVDYIIPEIMAGELAKVVDSRVGLPDIYEAEAVELVAYTAMHCVSYESKDRPTMADIVGNLERAFVICGDDDSHESISSDIIEISCE